MVIISSGQPSHKVQWSISLYSLGPTEERDVPFSSVSIRDRTKERPLPQNATDEIGTKH